MGDAPDYQRLAAEVLGIRGRAARACAPARRAGARRRGSARGVAACGRAHLRDAPPTPGVYVLRDAGGRALYVGKAVNLRRRLRAHFAERRWRALKAEMSRAADAEWQRGRLGARGAAARSGADSRAAADRERAGRRAGARRRATFPRALCAMSRRRCRRSKTDSAELVAARADGGWMIQRTRRNGADLAVHTTRLVAILQRRSSECRTRRRRCSRRLCFRGSRGAARTRRGSIRTRRRRRASCATRLDGAARRRSTVRRAS